MVVLLDGDGMIFNNDYLRQGERGGKEAASHLWSAMDTFIKQELSHLSSPIVIGRVYGNVRGLGEVLQKSGIIDYASQFDDFARGFNGSKLLFDFVDVGSGKDKADDKITGEPQRVPKFVLDCADGMRLEIFKLYLRDIHCHQLVLGCSHDNGYARLLEDIMGDSNFLERITLLEGVPFERELAELQRQFRTTKFNDLFRGSKVVAPSQYRAGPTAPLPSLLPDSRNTSPAPAPAVARQKSKSDELAAPTANASAAPVSWASKTAAPYTPSPSETELANKSNAGSANRATTTINRNRHGQRIDDLDTYIHNDDIKRIKRLKLCNVYYLIGPDACNNPRCNHDHEWPITKNDLRVLRQVARMAPCDYGTECDDPGCIYGHRCPQNNPNADSCFFGNDCWFAGWGHGIDTKICKTIKI